MDTYSRIGVMQLEDTNIPTITTAIAQRYDFVWGASPSKAAAWRAGNPNIETSYYMKSWRDNGTTWTNTTPLSLATWQSTHPDYVLYQADKVTPAYQTGSPNVALDFSLQRVVDWQSTTYASPASASGNFVSIAADNLSLNNAYGAIGSFSGTANAWVQDYVDSNDAAYRTNVGTWCSRFRAAIQALSIPLKLVPNFYSGTYAYNDAAVIAVIQNSDAINDESNFTIAPGHSGAGWVSRIGFMQTVQQTYGKGYYLVYALPDNSGAKAPLLYALATYLMGKYHKAYIAIVPTIAGNPDYNTEYYWPEYLSAARLGPPLEDMTLDQSIYRRKFVGGLVVVNNDATTTFSYILPAGSYVDLYGVPTSGTISLLPTTAIILKIVQAYSWL